jgi:hypothetical protein
MAGGLWRGQELARRQRSAICPGAIKPGEWAILCGVPNIRSSVTSRYVIQREYIANTRRSLGTILQPGPGWFTGDLHTHSGHSDGCRTDDRLSEMHW